MLPLFVLPAALITLLLASPVLSEPISPNNLFRAIILNTPRGPDPPVCCLKPTQPLSQLEEEVLLPFEEWKAKQAAELQEQQRLRAKEMDPANHSVHILGAENSGIDNGSDTGAHLVDTSATAVGSDIESISQPISPRFRVPLADRFNYANLDCSARVHTSHRSAKSSSSILSSKRDRYMLSPCNSSKSEKQFVVVELCEDIRIDTVQLANFEFFSGVFKDFSVSVAKTYNEDWTDAGKYTAKNVRGVQSFHTPISLRDFYRYIRIEFHSHYGSEYYCPISLLRVYGLTHLEEWKWDMWEMESKAKRDEMMQVAAPPPPATLSTPINETPATLPNYNADQPSIMPLPQPSAAATLSLDTSISTGPTPAVSSSGKSYLNKPSGDEVSTLSSATPLDDSHAPTRTGHKLTHSTDTYSTVQNITQTSIISLETPPHNPHQNSSSHFQSSSSLASNSTPTQAATPKPSRPIVISIPTMPSSVHAPSGGESIYRTIMNRLTALEANHTLYVRYVEQQTTGVHKLLKRLEEDVGRLEGNGRAQSLMYQRAVQDWEKQREQIQLEYKELLSRVDFLSGEVVLEKRLGIAQLCLLVTVLVFMGLTRGSRGESIQHVPRRLNSSVREWKRHLSVDWTNRFRRKSGSRSPVRPLLQSATSSRGDGLQNARVPPLKENTRPESYVYSDLSKRTLPSTESRPRVKTSSRSRTPSLRTPVRQFNHYHFHRNTGTPRPQLQRSNSQGANSSANGHWSGFVPTSAKKWARTAHLHEVKNGVGVHNTKGNVGDVFTTPRRRRRQTDSFHSTGLVDGRLKENVRHKEPQTYIFTDDSSDLWTDTDLDADFEGLGCQEGLPWIST
ncbi:UNC-like C-terminal-domain-containing protein [Infundibulicybe gibba]|nr:UNC-like C-terminal-domain-containing protein [Infundibulicybe gibba]